MSTKPFTQNQSPREIFELYLSNWKYILLSVLVFIALAYTFLRYTAPQFRATATIKIKDEKSSTKLPEISSLQNYGLFSIDTNNVIDEVEVITSNNIIGDVIKSLRYNVQIIKQGRIQGHEVYKNPPIDITFTASDSIIHKQDTSFNITIKTDSTYIFAEVKNAKESNPYLNKTLAFGEPIKTSFGDVIFTPNIDKHAPKKDENIIVKLKPVKAVASSYKKRLTIENPEHSSIVKLSIEDNLKLKSELFLNTLIERYNKDVIEDKLKVVKTTSDFINNRLEIVSQELESVDLTAENVQKKNRLTNLGAQSNLFLRTEKENEAKLIATENQIKLVQYMSDYINDSSRDSDLLPINVGIDDSSINTATNRYNELVIQRDRLLKNSSSKNPVVANLNNEIDALKLNIQASLDNVKSSNQITRNSLYAENRRISSQIYSAPKKQRQFRDIKRQQDIKESLYLYLLQKREETAISLGISSPNAKIIDYGYASNKPSSPKKALIYLSALIFGFSLPIGIIYMINLLDTKVKSIKDIKALIDVPFLGDIPKSKAKNAIIKKVDYSPRAEAFRLVRTNIEFMLQNINDRAKIVFVTSTTSKEGKSHTSTNLASSFSYTDKRVLLIETDIRKPKASKYLNVDNSLGLTDYLSNSEHSIEDVTNSIATNDNLFVIPSGTIPPNPAELLMSDRFEDLIETVKSQYDYIIVDTAAVGLVTDTHIISKFADLFVYVVRVNYLDKRELETLESLYKDKRLPHLAVLLNDLKHRRGYGYGYGGKKFKKLKK